MNHLDDFTLNEYLDHVLDKSTHAAVEKHLQACVACGARLDELQSFFAELDALPEIRLEHDLAPAILVRLPRKASIRIWTRAFAAQVGVAVGAFIWLGMQAVNFIRIPRIPIPVFPFFDIQTWVARLLSYQFPTPDFQFPNLSYQLPTFDFQLPFNLQSSTPNLVVLIVLVFLLWMVGNVVLLQSRQEAGK